MPYSNLIALTDFVQGREDDYNDWYEWVHLWDVMRLGAGVVAAQRFRKSDALSGAGRSGFTQPYLCIYEVTEPLAMTLAHQPIFTDVMPVSDAYSLTNVSEVYFDEIACFTRNPGVLGQGDVVIERINLGATSSKLKSWYVHERFATIGQLPSVIAGSVGQPNSHQLFEQDDLSGLCAVYWTSDLKATANAWEPLHHAELDPVAISLNSYVAIMERRTMVDIRAPNASDQAKALAKRGQLGDRVLKGPPTGIKSEHFN